MTYEEALGVVNHRLRLGVKPGLTRIEALCKAMGNPEKKLKFVHVAGTNGKGTTSTLIASVLQAAGYRTGLYTSPYVLEFRERFRIDGEMIPKEELIEEVAYAQEAESRMTDYRGEVSEFEFITALAFHWFLKRQCDVVVLEVGMGGITDATNVIGTPDAAAIVSISLDHTAYLGDTIEAVAGEKAGIIKPGGKVSLYPRLPEEALRVFQKTAAEKGAALLPADESRMVVGEETISGTHITWDGLPLYLPFTGEHQQLNAANALTAIGILKESGYCISDEALQKGFANARIPARMETLCEEPLVLLDGGHNPGCAEALEKVLKKHLTGRKITAIMGIMADKDSEQYLSFVAPLFSKIVTLAPHEPRALPAEALAEKARHYCGDVTAAGSVEEALRLAQVGRGEALVICGSFYLAAELRTPASELYKNQ